MTALILASCTMTDFCGTEAPPVEDGRIAQAKSWFEEEVVRIATKSSDSRKGFLNLGNIAPEWEYARCNVNRYTSNENVETGLESQYRFRVIQTDPETGKTRRVKCCHKLTVLQRPGDGGHGVFVVFYIASNSYSKTHRGILSERFQEDGRLGDYTGVKVYTTIEGKVVRVNRYENGEQVCGVFIPGIRTVRELNEAAELLHSMVGNMKFQIGRRIAPATKSGEDDDCWEWEDYHYKR